MKRFDSVDTLFPETYPEGYSNQRLVWLSLGLTLLSSIAISNAADLVGLFTSLGEAMEYPVWTFSSIWVLGFLILQARVIRTIPIRMSYFAGVSVAIGITGFIFWLFIPDSFSLIEPVYYGIESRATMETHTTGRYDENSDYDYPLEKWGLYRTGDGAISFHLRRLSMQNEWIDTVGFLTWQAGLSNGFEPVKGAVLGYKHPTTIKERLLLYLTVGPMVVAELSIRGIHRYLIPALILQLVYFWRTKRLIWWPVPGSSTAIWR